jgi:hypothetical protein
VAEQVCGLQEALSAGTIALAPAATRTSRRSKTAGTGCAGLDLILDQWGADMADLPGGASGLLVRGYQGEEGDTPVYKIDAGILAELRGHERAGHGDPSGRRVRPLRPSPTA